MKKTHIRAFESHELVQVNIVASLPFSFARVYNSGLSCVVVIFLSTKSFANVFKTNEFVVFSFLQSAPALL